MVKQHPLSVPARSRWEFGAVRRCQRSAQGAGVSGSRWQLALHETGGGTQTWHTVSATLGAAGDRTCAAFAKGIVKRDALGVTHQGGTSMTTAPDHPDSGWFVIRDYPGCSLKPESAGLKSDFKSGLASALPKTVLTGI